MTRHICRDDILIIRYRNMLPSYACSKRYHHPRPPTCRTDTAARYASFANRFRRPPTRKCAAVTRCVQKTRGASRGCSRQPAKRAMLCCFFLSLFLSSVLLQRTMPAGDARVCEHAQVIRLRERMPLICLVFPPLSLPDAAIIFTLMTSAACSCPRAFFFFFCPRRADAPTRERRCRAARALSVFD